MTITNGHAARMRYSRFKQQMEGHAPIRRPRNPQAKRGPKTKKSKDKDKDEEKPELKIKVEQSSSAENQGPLSSAAESNDEASQDSATVATSDVDVLKSEPVDDAESSQISSHFDYGVDPLDMNVQMMDMHSQVLPQVTAAEVMGYEMAPVMPPSPHDQRFYQSMMRHDMMDQSQSQSQDSVLNQPRYYGMPYAEMFTPHPYGDMRSSEPLMVKAEERWDDGYCHV